MGRAILIGILALFVAEGFAQETLTFTVRKSAPDDSGLSPGATAPRFVADPDPEFKVRHLVSWMSNIGFELENEKAEGLGLTVVSFEYGINATTEVRGVHNRYNPWNMYKEMVRQINYTQSGDRVYVCWLRVRTEHGDVLKVPDLKFIKKT